MTSPVNVNATVTPAEGVAFDSVTATIGAVVQSLTSNDGVHWYSSIGLSGEGQRTLAVEAIDKLSRSATAQVNFQLALPPSDPGPPTLSLAELNGVPMGDARILFETTAHVRAECTPKGNTCTSLSVLAGSGGPVLASAVDSLDTTIDLSAYGGTANTLQLVVVAKNLLGASAQIQETLAVTPPAAMQQIASTKGSIDDFDATRVVISDAAGIQLFQRGTQDLALVHAGGNGGRLFSKGVVWSGGMLRDGAEFVAPAWPVNPDPRTVFEVAGDYLFLPRTVRNLSTDVETSCPDTGLYGWGVAGNGDLVHVVEGTQPGHVQLLHRCRAGDDVEISTVRARGPVTDGINVAYLQNVTGDSVFVLLLYTGSSTINLGLASNYAVDNGWVAYSKSRSGLTPGVGDVWTRSPSGDVALASIFIDEAALLGLRPNGDVALSHGVIWFLGPSGQNAQQVQLAPNVGQVVGRSEGWYLTTKHFLYQFGNGGGGGNGTGGSSGSGGTSTGGQPTGGDFAGGRSGEGGDAGGASGEAGAGGTNLGGTLSTGGLTNTGGTIDLGGASNGGASNGGAAGEAGSDAGGEPMSTGGVATAGRGGNASGGRNATSGGRSEAGDSGAGAGNAAGNGSGSDGCSCDVVGSSRHSWAFALAAVGLSLLQTRRRRTRERHH
ncbi:MAG TPA: hypothetical protein VG937_16105 [Polyangiaceae bacterium]|nr:hypothetical protein [Polyangiaceae bacterium]